MLKNINGLDLSYRDSGSGLPVVLLHAFPLNQLMWDAQWDFLQDDYRIITVDLRGFGGSGSPRGPALMEQMATDVRELLTSIGIDRVVLAGLSMGGYVSFAFYRLYPESVRALVLADTRASADTPEARDRRHRSAERVEREGVNAISEDMVASLLGRTSLEKRPAVVQRVRSLIASNSAYGIAAAQRGMAQRRNSTDLLSEMDFPVLIIAGSEDSLTPVSEAEQMRDAVRGARLNVIEAAGHLSNIECPDDFNNALNAFLSELERE